jgi:soluble lytic murein transglycosylase
MKRLLLAVLLASLAAPGSRTQNPPDDQNKIKLAVESRDYAGAVSGLERMRLADERAFTAGNYDYLLARMAEAAGSWAAAMTNYQKVADRGSVLRPYALAHLSQIARLTGNLMLERLFLHGLRITSPENLLGGGAQARLARNNFETGNFGEAIRILERGEAGGGFGTGGGNARQREAARRDDLALLGEAYMRSGQTAPARQTFDKLLNNTPDPDQPDDAAEKASMGLDLLDVGADNFEKKALVLTDAEQLRRANIYRFHRNFINAKLHYEGLLANSPAADAAANAVFQIGRIYVQEKDFAEAGRWFERVLEQYPESAAARDALLNSGSAYSRVGKPREAIRRYQRFIDSYPTDDRLDRAYLNIVDIMRDHGSDSDALKWCAKTRDVFSGKLPATLALFSEARIYIARDDWQSALNVLESLTKAGELGGAAVPGGTNPAEIKFLRGFVLEQMKAYTDSIDAYLSIGDGRDSYYGWRATQRLKQLSNDELWRPAMSQKLGEMSTELNSKDPEIRRRAAQAVLRLTEATEVRAKALAILKAAMKVLPRYQDAPNFEVSDLGAKSVENENPHQTIADKLMSLGLYDEAAPELEAARLGRPKAEDNEAFSVAMVYKRGDRADRSLELLEPLWRKMPADYPIELVPPGQLEMLYPAPYRDEVLTFAAVRGVDPRFLLAIMRQESRFRPDARSNAAARGLMQFISPTANQIAGELGREGFRQDELYFPPTAILFGSQYLADLFRQFPNQSEAVAVSYNAGEDNMARWLARAKSGQADRYVPEVMFSQSKDYVYKVMANYRMYQFMYDSDLHRIETEASSQQ